MIWDSIFFMTVIDLVVLLGFIFSFGYFLKRNPHFSWKRAKRGFLVLFFGLGFIVSFFFVELFTMHLLPFFIPEPQAMELMRNLHGNYMWFIIPPGVFLLTAGLVLVITRYGQNVSLLEDSQEQFKMLADNANDLIIIHDEKGKRLYVSPAVKRQLGLDLKDLEGKPAWFSVHPRDRERVYKEWFQRIFVEKKSHKVRVQMKHADGHYIWFENVSEPVIDETGKVKAAVSISRNITEQREAEEIAELAKRDLQDREEFQHTIMDTMVDCLIVIDKKGTILSVNKTTAKVFQYSEKYLIGKPITILMAASHRKLHERGLARFLKTGKGKVIGVGAVEVTGLRKDGKQIDLELAIETATEKGQQVFVGSLRDISMRKQAKAAVKQAEEQYKMLADYGNDIVFLRNTKGKVLYVSPSLKRHLGIDPKDQVGKTVSNLLYPEDIKNLKKEWELTVLKIKKTYKSQIRLKHKNGSSVWFESLTEPVLGENGKVKAVVTSSRNITEQKEAEEKFRLVAEHANDIITLRDADTKVVYVSPSYEKHLGRSPGEYKGTTFETIPIHPEDKEFFNTWQKQVFKKGKPFIGVFRVKAQSGEYVWFESETEPIKDAKGKVTGAVTISRNFTQQKEEEDRRIQLGRILDNSLTEIYITDLGTQKYVFANKAARDNLGYSLAELRKMSPLDFSQVLEGKPELLVESYKPLQTGEKEKLMFESSFLRKDGSKYEVEVNLQLSEWNNRPVVVANIEDISIRKEEEDKRIQLGRILDNSLIEIYIADVKTLRYVFANQAARKNLGYSLSELQKMTPLDVSQALQGKPKLLIESMKPLKTGEKEKVRFESTYLRKDGTKYAAEVTLQLSEMDNKPVIIANVEDISIRKEEEDKRVQLGRILDNSMNEIYISDLETLRYVFANQAARNNLGYSLEELQKMTPLDTNQVLKEQPGLLAKRLKPLQTGKKEKDRFESMFIRKDGSKYSTEVTLQLSEMDNKPVVVANVEDITIKKETAAQLRQAQKMEAVGQLTGGIAHDFNNLLTAMQGGIRLAEQENISDTARECLEISMGAVKRGADLTHRLLAFSRTQTLKPEVVDINDLVRGFEPLLRRTLGDIIEIETIQMKQKRFVKVDVRELENSLLNLSLNARDAMPRGGLLTIEVEKKKITRSQADQKDLSPGDFIILSVSDTGSGMPPEIRDHIFEPFFTTKEEGKGTGLGLSTVFGFVKQSGGHVTVYSEAGIGTTFRLYLPETKKQKVVKAKKKKAVISHHIETGKILLVEDNDEVRAFVAKALGIKGYSVLEAENGPEALKLMNKNSDIDLLLTDIVLPKGMDGVEVGKKFKKIFPGSEVIYSSGFTTRAIEKKGFLKEGEELLSKPYDLGELFEKVNSGLQNKKP